MPLDTDARAREAQLAAIRRMTPSERFRLAAEMSEDARRIAAECRRHPELTLAEARLVVLRRLWGPELAARVAARSGPGR